MSSEKPVIHHRGPSYSTPPALIAFTLAIVVVCFAGFTIVYFCRCCLQNIFHTWGFHRTPSGPIVHLSQNNNNNNNTNTATPQPVGGLDSLILNSFPTFSYATVKNLRREKHALECAICLVEFEERSILRLLTVCYHVFHEECIDLWLESHKTCPVCRTDLDHVQRSEDHVTVDVKEGEGNDGGDEQMGVGERRFTRSHSTGHSVVMVRDGGEEEDRYTLRLEENVRLRFVRGGRGHSYTKSCSSYRDMNGFGAPCRNCGFVQTGFSCSSNSGIQNVH